MSNLKKPSRKVVLLAGTLACVWLTGTMTVDGQQMPNLSPIPNSTGLLETLNASGDPISLAGAFFQSLGTNGRSCFTCHRPAQGWTVSTDELKTRFETTQGQDPIFRPVDGANCNTTGDPTALPERRKAYSLLLNRGIVRVEMQVPASAEFTVVGVDNPYGCIDRGSVSVYRRPIPTTNLRALSAIMWDGRESAPQTGTSKITFQTNPSDLMANLQHQAMDATNIHAQASASIPADVRKEIADFMMSLTTAQWYDYAAGCLNCDGATGGAKALANSSMQGFYVGTNDPLGGNPKYTPFTSKVFSLYDAWVDGATDGANPARNERRASIARGQTIFNTQQINIVNVAGLNDDLNTPSIPGFCGTCHDSPNIGNHSLPVPLNIGVGDLNSPLDVSYLPVFTLQNKKTFEVVKTTDPGRALVTGVWKDIGRMKGPILRGLSSRAPYFHNGSAQTLDDVVDFYDKRFNIGFTADQKKDLAAFLSTL